MFKAYAKIWAILSPRERREFVALGVLTVFMGLADFVGVASILPFLAVLSDPAIMEKRPEIAAIYEFAGFDSRFAFLQFLGIVVFALVMGSILAKAATFYLLSRFTHHRTRVLSVRLLRRYLAHPYEWFLNRHSAELGKSILQEVSQAVTGSIAPATKLLANGVVAFFLLALLVAVEPIGAIVTALLLGGVFGTIYLFNRRRLLEIGRERAQANRDRFQVTQEAMAGIKTVKLHGMEDAYAARFDQPAARLSRHQTSIALIGEMPRYALEAFAYGGMLLFVLWLLWSRGGDLSAVLPILGVYAFAGLRLMPTAQELFRNVSKLRFGAPVLERLHDDLLAPWPDEPTDAGSPLHLRQEIRLEDVHYRYPQAEREALCGVSLSIEKGEKIGFVGPTGAGKTTVVDILLGLLEPSSGLLVVDGVPVTAENRRAWQSALAYVPQSIFLVDDTIAANIAFGERSEDIDLAAVERAARQAGLHEHVESLARGYLTDVGDAGVRLSGGQRQRIGIARALYQNPDVLVLDEATSALDTVTEKRVMDRVHALGLETTVIIIAHRLSTVRHCDRIVVMEDGVVESHDPYDSLAAGSAAFRALLAAAE